MDDGEDVLEIGSRREPRPARTRALLALAVAGAVGAYFLVHDRDHSNQQALPSRTTTSVPVIGPAPTLVAPGGLPPWPETAGACGNNTFLPIVSAQPLHERTGVRVIVGDRLSTVDVDAATVTPRAGLAHGVYAAEIATTGGGTYATLIKCQDDAVTRSTIVRLDPDGGLRTVATGRYAQLLSGGDHPWGLIYHDDGSTTMDPLDGSRALTVPADFVPTAGYRDLIVGSAVLHSHSSSEGPQTVQVVDPHTWRVVRTLGEASSMAVSRGVVLWTDYRCPHGQCALHAYDLAAGAAVSTSARTARDAGLWSAVLSPDRHAIAYVRQRSAPSQYDMGHPGNPNEVVTVDLRTGRNSVVPALEIWSKSTPGLDYSPDSRWLVMSLDAGSRVRLLLWHPGLARPLEPSVRVIGSVAFAPVLTSVG